MAGEGNATNGDVTKPMTDEANVARAGERVSVVIPAYNVAGFLEETLQSVFAQTVPVFEVLVVNDGSPDSAALERVLEPYRERIRYLVQENQGPSAARNAGIDEATGAFIAFLDGDDVWLPGYVERQMEYLRTHPAHDLVYCNAVFFGDSIYAGQEYMTVCPSTGEADAAALIERRCHVFTSVMGRAAALKTMRFDVALWSSEDFDYWLRLSAAGFRIGYHREVLVRYRKRQTSLSADPTSMARANLAALSKAMPLWTVESREGRALREAAARKSAELGVMRGKIALRASDTRLAVSHLRQANAYYKSAKLSLVVALVRYAPALVRSLYSFRERRFQGYRGTN